METVALILSPLIWIMRAMLDGLAAWAGYGSAIIILSTLIRVMTTPIAERAAVAGRRHTEKLAAMEAAVADIKATSRGRERFERIDALYTQNNYHPIHSMVSLLPLLAQIPFLLSALVLLTGHAALRGESFLFIRDLSAPDQLLPLLGQVRANALPIALTGIAMLEAFIRRGASAGSRIKFSIVSTVIAVVIYPLPAAVCLYWLTSNLWSLVTEILRRGHGEQTGG